MSANVAVSHASGLAAQAILEKLPESGIPPDSLILLDDELNLGKRHAYSGGYVKSLDQAVFDFSNCALLIMPEADPQLEQRAIAQSCLLISHAIERESVGMIAMPNEAIEISYTQDSLRLVNADLSCLLPVLLELQQISPIESVNATLIRSAEFHGKAGIDELAEQTIALLNSRKAISKVFADQIAFNLLPQREGPAIAADLAHYLGNNTDSNILQFINAPIFHGLVAAIQLEFAAEIDLEQAKQRLSAADNIIVKSGAASPISDCNQSFSCVISLVEQVSNRPSSLQFWMIADPMRYGIANNYVKVTDFLLKSFL